MKIYLHPFPLRIWHWVFAALTILLIITGIKLRMPEIGFFSYRSATLVHKLAGYVMTAAFFFWLILSLMNGSLKKHYVLKPEDLSGMVRQADFYLFGYFRRNNNPFHPSTTEEKFNPLQKLSYIFIMLVFTPVIILTGLLFSNVLFFRPVIDALGGIRVLDAFHVTGAYVFVVYLIAHIYMATLGSTPLEHIKAMFTGDEEVPETDSPPADSV
jgi:thiosulfate reductase cytochrome b subunit